MWGLESSCRPPIGPPRRSTWRGFYAMRWGDSTWGPHCHTSSHMRKDVLPPSRRYTWRDQRNYRAENQRRTWPAEANWRLRFVNMTFLTVFSSLLCLLERVLLVEVKKYYFTVEVQSATNFLWLSLFANYKLNENYTNLMTMYFEKLSLSNPFRCSILVFVIT